MEFRRTPLLNYWVYPPIRLPRDRDWIPCRDRDLSSQIIRTGYEHRWKNNMKIDLPEIVSEVLTVINLARIGRIGWLFWTRWWIFWFHEVQELSWLVEEISGSEEGQCCMEFRRTPLLNYWVCPPIRLPRDRDWIPCRDRDLSPQNIRTGYEIHTVYCPLDTGNFFYRLKWPPREAEPHLHEVSTLGKCVVLYFHSRICL
jgi:hypothetical protein